MVGWVIGSSLKINFSCHCEDNGHHFRRIRIRIVFLFSIVQWNLLRNSVKMFTLVTRVVVLTELNSHRIFAHSMHITFPVMLQSWWEMSMALILFSSSNFHENHLGVCEVCEVNTDSPSGLSVTRSLFNA